MSSNYNGVIKDDYESDVEQENYHLEVLNDGESHSIKQSNLFSEYSIPSLANNNIFKNMFKPYLDSGIIKKFSLDNIPFSYTFSNKNISRRLKIHGLEKNIKTTRNDYVVVNGSRFNSCYHLTNIKKNIDSRKDVEITNEELEKIIDFCISNGINYIIDIQLIRECIIYDIDGECINSDYFIDDFIDDVDVEKSDYYKAKKEMLTKLDDEIEEEASPAKGYYMMKYDRYDDKSYHKTLLNKDNHYTKKKCEVYVFNQGYFKVNGIKTYKKDLVDIWSKCKDDIEFFKKTFLDK